MNATTTIAAIISSPSIQVARRTPERRNYWSAHELSLMGSRRNAVSDLPKAKNQPSAAVALHELWKGRTEWMPDITAVHAFLSAVRSPRANF